MLVERPAGGAVALLQPRTQHSVAVGVVMVKLFLLIISPATQPLSWRGETNGVDYGDWTTNAPDVNTNWLDTVQLITTGYIDGSPVQFDDTLTGTSAVNIPGVRAAGQSSS